jgi:hypothetical protein
MTKYDVLAEKEIRSLAKQLWVMQFVIRNETIPDDEIFDRAALFYARLPKILIEDEDEAMQAVLGFLMEIAPKGAFVTRIKIVVNQYTHALIEKCLAELMEGRLIRLVPRANGTREYFYVPEMSRKTIED